MIESSEKIKLMSLDKSNLYSFTKIKESEDRRFITFSISSTTNHLPFDNNGDGMKIRNGIFDYYIGEITVETKFLSDNNLWDFVHQRHQ